MRQIKFRGKRNDQDEWVFGDLVEENGGETYIVQANIIQWKQFEVDPDTVSQFTGLTDKNEKEIYEGDILAVNSKIVGFVEGGVRGYCYDVVYISPLTNGEKRWSLYATLNSDYPNKLEINGNIHDNPELLNPQ